MVSQKHYAQAPKCYGFTFVFARVGSRKNGLSAGLVCLVLLQRLLVYSVFGIACTSLFTPRLDKAKRQEYSS
jgi:hypothetical protein